MSSKKYIALGYLLFLVFTPFVDSYATVHNTQEWVQAGKSPKKKALDLTDAETARTFAASVIMESDINEHILQDHTLSSHRADSSFFNTDDPEKIKKILLSALHSVYRIKRISNETSVRVDGSSTKRLVIEAVIVGSRVPFGLYDAGGSRAGSQPNGVRIVINVSERDLVTAFPMTIKN